MGRATCLAKTRIQGKRRQSAKICIRQSLQRVDGSERFVCMGMIAYRENNLVTMVITMWIDVRFLSEEQTWL
jgi:hypothetical protein